MLRFFRKKKPEAKPEAKPEKAVEPEKKAKPEKEVEPQKAVEPEKKAKPPKAVEPEKKAKPEKEVEKPEKPEKIAEKVKELKAKPKAKLSFFEKIKTTIKKTTNTLGSQIESLFLGKKQIDESTLEELETILLQADIGWDVTEEIIENLTEELSRSDLKDNQALLESLKKYLNEILHQCEEPLVIKKQDNPFVILMIGVNGAGKTTSIGKIASHFKDQNKKVLLAAGDTFRAAAVEQLQAWGERNDVNVISQKQGSDSASVVYDALESAFAKKYDVLLIDTAGRLHNKENLMQELAKIKRVLQKKDIEAPHEVMLVIDATNGQNALTQAKEFNDFMGLTGITLSKLDGTAKGGIVFAIAKELNIPIRFIGIGEKKEDLLVFESKPFVDAIFSVNTKARSPKKG